MRRALVLSVRGRCRPGSRAMSEATTPARASSKGDSERTLNRTKSTATRWNLVDTTSRKYGRPERCQPLNYVTHFQAPRYRSKSAPRTNAVDGSDRTHRSDRCSKRRSGLTIFRPDGRRSRQQTAKCTAADDTTSRRRLARARASRPRKNEEPRRMAMTSKLFDWTPRCSTRGSRAAAIPSDAGEVPVGGSSEDSQALSFKPRRSLLPARTMR